MVNTWIEMSCDNCGQADYYPPSGHEKAARKNGWIITRDKKHYCDSRCKKKAEDKS